MSILSQLPQITSAAVIPNSYRYGNLLLPHVKLQACSVSQRSLGPKIPVSPKCFMTLLALLQDCRTSLYDLLSKSNCVM